MLPPDRDESKCQLSPPRAERCRAVVPIRTVAVLVFRGEFQSIVYDPKVL